MPTEPQIVTAANLMTQVQPFTKNANELQLQAERAEIVTSDDFSKATDFIKICNAQINSLEDARKALTKPLNDHVKWINNQIKPIKEGIDAAKQIMNGKGAVWKKAEDERVREEAEKERQRAEQQAQDDAEEAEKQGDPEKADAIMEAAIDTPEAKQTADNVRGAMTGATGGLKVTWSGEVGDVKQICAAVVSGDLPTHLITVSKSGMNEIARGRREEGPHHGIKIIKKEDMNVH